MLLGHCVKIWEYKITKKMRDKILLSNYQFGFISEKLAIEPLFCAIQFMTKNEEKQKSYGTV